MTCKCQPGGVQEHEPYCELAPLDAFKTKDAFLEGAETSARADAEVYRICRDDEGMSHEEALEQVVYDAREAAACFAGIGSCYGGGCKH